MSRILLAIVICLTALANVGCGGSGRYGVKGKVSLDGSPLESGEISFVPVDPKLGPTAGAPIAGGQYEIKADKGLVPGDYVVRINAFGKTGKKMWDGMGDEKAPSHMKNYVDEIKPLVPARYNEKSELRATIEAGKDNVFDFNLEGGRRP